MKQIVKAFASRGHGSWIASTQGLPDNKQALSTGKTWKQAKQLLQRATEMTLRAPSDSVVIDLKLEDPNLQKLVDEVHQRRTALREAEFHYGAAMGLAARTLTKTMTVRDVAAMLGCSPQHVAKLAQKPSS
jgi:hypothetical protein